MRYRALVLTAVALFLSFGSPPAQEKPPDAPPVVEVTGFDYAFQAPDTIPAGWTALRFHNRGSELHVFDLLRLPDGRTYGDLRREFFPAADSVLQAFGAGRIGGQEARAALARVRPAWMGEMEAGQGVGLTSPGHTAETTLRLEPGVYYMKCFVFTEDRLVHWGLGMRRALVVTEGASRGSPPEADVTVTVADYSIRMDGEVSAGQTTFAVRFGERSGVGDSPYQDLHLARLEEKTPVEEVVSWSAGPFEAPAPATFLGGAHAAPAGERQYLTAELAPGRYAWISDASAPKGMVHAFTVE